MSHVLSSFGESICALIVGANGGLGSAFVNALKNSDSIAAIHAWSRTSMAANDSRIMTSIVDVHDEDSIAHAASEIDHLNLVVVATGALHNSKTNRR